MDDAAAAFVYAYGMSQPGMALANRLWWESGLFGGPRAAIAELIGRGERGTVGRFAQDIVAEYPDGPFKQDVLAVTV